MTFPMYHVTDISEDDSPSHPNWTVVNTGVSDDRTYDGELVGLPVASFTTTQYQGGLPTISPYPRDGIEGRMYWRVKVPFEYDKYNIYLMNNHQTQIHLLCLAKNGTDVENLLSVILKSKSLTQTGANVCFPDGQPNEYTDSKIFVNVNFITPIKIWNEFSWDTVERGSQFHGELATIDRSRSNSSILYEWGLSRLQEAWDDAIQSFTDATYQINSRS